MSNGKILIVEDEGIVVADLQTMVKRLGYTVVGTAATGEDAVKQAELLRPDLILMDIHLDGEMDGIHAAEQIMVHNDIPVTYLTAFADETTVERAKTTLPFGYILKPFEERDLRTAIELALYKHRMQKMLGQIEGWYASALQSLGDGVIATNHTSQVTFMNAVSESLTGWKLQEAYGKHLNDIFQISVPVSGQSLQGTKTSAMLKNQKGQESSIEYTQAPIKNEEGKEVGLTIVFHSLKPAAQ